MMFNATRSGSVRDDKLVPAATPAAPSRSGTIRDENNNKSRATEVRPGKERLAVRDGRLVVLVQNSG